MAMQGTTPPKGQTPSGVVRIDVSSPLQPVSPSLPGPVGIVPAAFPEELQERVARVRQVQGRLLCQRSPVVALKATALAGCGAFATGVASGWFVLHKESILVTSTDQRVVLTLVSGVFALTVGAGTAGYATARWWHARTIPSKGRVGASGLGLLLALVVAGAVVATLQPWSFPSANVAVASPLVVGLDLAQHQVSGGLMVYGKDNTVVVYLRTTRGEVGRGGDPEKCGGGRLSGDSRFGWCHIYAGGNRSGDWRAPRGRLAEAYRVAMVRGWRDGIVDGCVGGGPTTPVAQRTVACARGQ